MYIHIIQAGGAVRVSARRRDRQAAAERDSFRRDAIGRLVIEDGIQRMGVGDSQQWVMGNVMIGTRNHNDAVASVLPQSEAALDHGELEVYQKLRDYTHSVAEAQVCV